MDRSICGGFFSNMVITIKLTEEQAQSMQRLSRFGSPEDITRKAFAILSLFSKEEEGTQIGFIKDGNITTIVTGL